MEKEPKSFSDEKADAIMGDKSMAKEREMSRDIAHGAFMHGEISEKEFLELTTVGLSPEAKSLLTDKVVELDGYPYDLYLNGDIPEKQFLELIEKMSPIGGVYCAGWNRVGNGFINSLTKDVLIKLNENYEDILIALGSYKTKEEGLNVAIGLLSDYGLKKEYHVECGDEDEDGFEIYLEGTNISPKPYFPINTKY